jgi:hypothetical protein
MSVNQLINYNQLPEMGNILPHGFLKFWITNDDNPDDSFNFTFFLGSSLFWRILFEMNTENFLTYRFSHSYETGL